MQDGYVEKIQLEDLEMEDPDVYENNEENAPDN